MNIQLTNNTPAIVYPEPPAFVPRKTSRAWAAAGQIIEARKQGLSINKLAERFNVSWNTIEKIIKTNAPAIDGTPKAKMDKKLHLAEQQNLALQAELKTERKRSQKARDAYRAERDKAEMARQSYTGLAKNTQANVENLKAELAEVKDWGKKWKAEHADIVQRLTAEQSCLADQKQMTKSAREAYEGAKKSVRELSDKLHGTKGALETATKIVDDHEAQINELRETLELANAATNALQQKLDQAETEVTNARIAEQAAHDRLNDPSWANRWSKEAHNEFEKRKQAELDLLAAEAQLERMAEKLAECRNRGFFARVFG